jgi:hypothetical protein
MMRLRSSDRTRMPKRATPTDRTPSRAHPAIRATARRAATGSVDPYRLAVCQSHWATECGGGSYVLKAWLSIAAFRHKGSTIEEEMATR